jgi:hypothetical protein
MFNSGRSHPFVVVPAIPSILFRGLPRSTARIGSTSGQVPEARLLLLRYHRYEVCDVQPHGTAEVGARNCVYARRITIRALRSHQLIHRRHCRGFERQDLGSTATTFDDSAEHWRNTTEFPLCSPQCADER